MAGNFTCPDGYVNGGYGEGDYYADGFGRCDTCDVGYFRHFVKGTCEEANFENCGRGAEGGEGYAMRVQYTAGAFYEVHACDVVGFLSRPNDEHGMHAPRLAS